MAGIIQSQQGSGQSITPDMIRSKMQIPANLQRPYLAIVAAGRKIMYSPQMQQQIRQMLAEPGDIGSKLGRAIAALMAILYKESNDTLPKQLIIPAGTELAAHGADLLRSAGVKVTDQDVSMAVQTMIQTLVQRMGGSPDQINAAVTQLQSMGALNEGAGPPPVGVGAAGGQQ